MTSTTAQPWDGLDPRSSGSARRFRVQPCTYEVDSEGDETTVLAFPPHALWWGVFYQHDGDNDWLALSDHENENEALQVAFHFANGRAVYSFDRAGGECLAPDPWSK